MQITLEYTAQLRRAAGCRTEQMDVPEGCNLTQLLHVAADKHTPEFRNLLLMPTGERQPSLLLFLEDHQLLAGADPVLDAGARVTIMSPISGG
ncbi:MAG: MoaD/ThiS family protein [Planctomycetaceae bacterium]